MLHCLGTISTVTHTKYALFIASRRPTFSTTHVIAQPVSLSTETLLTIKLSRIRHRREHIRYFHFKLKLLWILDPKSCVPLILTVAASSLGVHCKLAIKSLGLLDWGLCRFHKQPYFFSTCNESDTQILATLS